MIDRVQLRLPLRCYIIFLHQPFSDQKLTKSVTRSAIRSSTISFYKYFFVFFSCYIFFYPFFSVRYNCNNTLSTLFAPPPPLLAKQNQTEDYLFIRQLDCDCKHDIVYLSVYFVLLQLTQFCYNFFLLYKKSRILRQPYRKTLQIGLCL